MNRTRTFRNLTHRHPLSTVLVCLIAVLCAVTPLASHSLWWNVCRGRAVWQGQWRPSASLVENGNLPDSDILNGVVSWLVFDLAGINGLMTLKIAVGLLIGLLICRLFRQRPHLAFFAAAMIIGVSPNFSPTDRAVDLIGMATLSILLAENRNVAAILAVVVWSNFSVGAIWCLPVAIVFCSANRTTVSRYQHVMLILSLLAALCANYRGVYAPMDMVRTNLPFLFYDSQLLAGTAFQRASLTMPGLICAGLTLIAVADPQIRGSRLVLIAACFCGIANGRNMALAGMLSGLALLQHNQAQDAARKTVLDHEIPGRILRGGISLSLLIALLVVASGDIHGDRERCGWGMSESLDFRLSERDLNQHRGLSLVAHCSDTNSAGLFLLTQPSARVLDVSEVAVKHGRFERLGMLNRDLATGRKKAYTRPDGTEGGWWPTLMNGSIELLVISPDRTKILASLEPTLWKPMSLDSAGIIFAKAGSAAFTPQIINVQNQRNQVDFGPWRHRLSSLVPNRSHVDFWQAMTGQIDARQDIRQAGVFRAMGILNGAAKTLFPVLDSNCRPTGNTEFQEIQRQFSWREFLHSGRTSDWRLAVLNELNIPSVTEHFPGLSSNTKSKRSDSAAPMAFQEAAKLYCLGRCEQAVSLLDESTAESLYAGHNLYFHAGKLEAADRILELFRDTAPDHPLLSVAELERGIE